MKKTSTGTFILPKGGAVVTNAGTVTGLHENVICSTADQVTQGAVGAGAVAGNCLPLATCRHGIGCCICAGGPAHLGRIGTTYQATGHIQGRTRLWRGQTFKNILIKHLYLEGKIFMGEFHVVLPVFKVTVSLC